MKKNIFLGFSLVSMVLLPLFAVAQTGNTDFFRSIGKIYVVVAVLLVILVGFFISLFLLERRIAKLEKINE